MNGLLIPGSVGVLSFLGARALFKNGYPDLGIVALGTTLTTGYFMIYDYRRRSNPEYKKNLVEARRKQYKAASSRPIEQFLQAFIDQYGSIDTLRHPQLNQQQLMKYIQVGEMYLGEGDKHKAIQNFVLAADISYIAGGQEKGMRLISTISQMIPDLRDSLLSEYEKDKICMEKFLSSQSKPITAEEFIRNLKAKQNPKVMEVLDEDSIDEDSEDEGEKTTPKVENIVEAEPKGLEVNEPVLQEVEQEQEEEAPVDDVDSEKQNSNAFSTPEVLSGSDFNQEEEKVALSEEQYIEEIADEIVEEVVEETIPSEVYATPVVSETNVSLADESSPPLEEEVAISSATSAATVTESIVEPEVVEPEVIAVHSMQPISDDFPAGDAPESIKTDDVILSEPVMEDQELE